jgi:squalene synthase HpnC
VVAVIEMGQARAGENFSVAGRLLPATLRRDLLAIYAYARSVDDIGDEGSLAAPDRLAALAAVDADLDRLFAGEHPRLGFVAGLAGTVAVHRLPREPFADLVAANRQDQHVSSYASWAELRDYCRLSAEPVGRLVLGVVGAATADRVAAADRVCTGLQVVEHLQDVGEDARAGRVYLPADDLARFGVATADLTAPTSRRELRGLLAFEGARARDLLESGSMLVSSLRGAPRLAVAGFVAGGLAALDALAGAGWDVLVEQVRPRRSRTMALTASLVARGTAGPRR